MKKLQFAWEGTLLFLKSFFSIEMGAKTRIVPHSTLKSETLCIQYWG